MFETIKSETDPVAAIKTQIEILAGEDRDHWPASALSERLVTMLEARERFDAEITRLAGHWMANEPGPPTVPCPVRDG